MATGSIIPQFEKSIKFDRTTRDFCVTVNGECIGYASTYTAGETLADDYVYAQLHITESSSSPVQEAAAALVHAAQDAGDTRTARALNKAAYHLSQGVAPREVRPGEFLVPSGTRGAVIHRVSSTRGCSCEAAAKGFPCWHLSAVTIMRAARLTLAA